MTEQHRLFMPSPVPAMRSVERPGGRPREWPATCAFDGRVRPAHPRGQCELCDLEEERAIDRVRGERRGGGS